MRIRRRFLYDVLGVLFIIPLTYHIREIRYRADRIIHWTDHVQNPIRKDFPGSRILSVEAEAESAGLREGDTISAISGRTYRGEADLYVPLLDARPGDRLDVQVRSSAGEVTDASILLQSRPAAFTGHDIVLQIIGEGMPIFCIVLGFWVAAVRIEDPLAWIFLGMMISFGEAIGIGSYAAVFGYDDFLLPVISLYNQFSANAWSVFMLLFGIYFPERLGIDRRWPWMKWLLAGPILLRATQNGVAAALAGNHVTAAMSVAGILGGTSAFVVFHMVAISCFMASTGYKTFSAASRDAKRRLSLLYYGATFSITPALIQILGNVFRGLPPFASSTFVFYVMLVGFPLTTAYVIVIERAMDVSIVVRQGLQYVLASKALRFVQIALSAAVIVLVTVSGQNMTAPERLALLSLGLIAAALIRRVADEARVWIDRRFFREAYDAEQILSDLADKVRTIVETRPLLETVVHRISESLHVPRVSILLNGGDSFQLSCASGYPPGRKVLIPVSSPDLDTTVRKELDAELVLPLSLNQKTLGLLSLGPKRSEEPYSSADLRLLRSVAAQTGLALENSRLMAEIAAEVAQRERLNREIEIAREVQERLFPQDVPQIRGFDFAGFCRPAS